jgi:L-asparaginase II
VNPILAHVTRGPIVESSHRGAYAVVDRAENVVASEGDIAHPVFPRSAIKAFQCLPLIESGAATRFGLTPEEIALCCSSHNGEPDHVRVAASILHKCGVKEETFECGGHWPERMDDRTVLIKRGEGPRSIHNNCSGKHAGMIALATHLGIDPSGYVEAAHPVQQSIVAVINRHCDVDVAKAPVGIDGCSVPTWALPLQNTALGFARLIASGKNIIEAVRAHPFMVAGTGRFDTKIMQAVPRLFIKVGAEGVFCGCIPHASLGFALKIDDGGTRGAEVAIARVLSELDVWTTEEREALKSFTHTTLKNWMKKEVGETQAAF